jgi:hypothetical protein
MAIGFAIDISRWADDAWSWVFGVCMVVAVLLIALSGLLGGFAETYYVLFGHSAQHFSPPLTPMRAAYFTWGEFTTAGSGISARSPGAQLLAIAQMAVGLFVVFGVFAFIATSLRFPKVNDSTENEEASRPPSSPGVVGGTTDQAHTERDV